MINRVNKKLLLVLIDIILIATSYFLVILTVREGSYMSHFLSYRTLNTIILTASIFIIMMFITGVYSYLWIYAVMKDFFICFMVCIPAAILTYVISFIDSAVFLPYKYILASGFLAAIFIVGIRITIKIVYTMIREQFKINENKSKNLLIIGAGSASALAIRSINDDKEHKYNIVGTIDDDVKKIGFRVYGVKVLGSRYDIKEICEEYKVEEILFAIPSIGEKDKLEILDICSETSCKIKIMPRAVSAFDKIEIKKDIRDVQLEDLLQRDIVNLQIDKINEYINGSVALVTGGGGSIGSELCRQIASFNPKKLIIVDIYENNAYDIQNELLKEYPEMELEVLIASVRDIGRMEKIFDRFKPDVVFHAAAHKHVPLMEESSGEAIKNNVCGTLNVCLCADKYNVKKMVLISTDKAVNPTNIMGASKRICEMIVQAIDKRSKTDFVAVRFGNVLGSNGSVVPLFQKQIIAGGPVTVTHKEVTRYFMLIPEAAQLVLDAATYAKGGEIFVLDMGKPVKIYDLAKKMIKLSGYEVDKDIEIKVTGLRPGEKLYEELLMNEEGLTSTANKKIFIAKPSDFDFDTLKAEIEILNKLANEESISELRDYMKKIVPTFKEAM